MRLFLLLLALAVSGAYAQSHEQLARDYHAIVFPTQRETLLDEHTSAAMESRPALAPHRAGYRAWLARLLDSKDYEETMVKTYLELLGVDELRSLVANARIPAYHQYMVDQPLLDRVKADRTRALIRSRESELLQRLNHSPGKEPPQ